jgi:hypothetical protein
MVQTFKSFEEMLAHLRHKDVEVKHKAVKVEEVKPKKKRKAKKKEDK